ncbi:MAG: BrnA antitoxin family protein [Ruminococcus sp.]|nr:BrnA antitoxin family protein [Ruminococcus sp.]MCM1382662.1 BrnA antitoxin family protein [Muribaculaceae bacterium]MCM1478601.1 BrnA antitoxin family protein [Muribaculaceae bacterium]
MVRTHYIDFSKGLTEEQLKELEEAEKSPIVYDEDCPELTDEQLRQFRRISDERQEERRKQSVTLRLSPQAIRTAKSLGKGYTSVLSRILESALADSETIKHYL